MIKPKKLPTGGDVLAIPPTGNASLDQFLRQVADHINATHNQLEQITNDHARVIDDHKAQAPEQMQKELSTTGKAPLNLNGLLGTPSVLQKNVGSNSGGALTLPGNIQTPGDPGPATGQVQRWVVFNIGNAQYFLPLFQ